MRSLPNIDKSSFRKGEYVGYAGGHVWNIRREGRRAWQAFIAKGAYSAWLHAPRLVDISAQLTAWDNTKAREYAEELAKAYQAEHGWNGDVGNHCGG